MAFDPRFSTVFLSQFRRVNVCFAFLSIEESDRFHCFALTIDSTQSTEMEYGQQNTKCQFSLQSQNAQFQYGT